jgi:hypothetical protein
MIKKFRNDLPDLMILVSLFQNFDKGEIIEQSFPEELKFESGDGFCWECAQFHGTAVIISHNQGMCKIKKVS